VATLFKKWTAEILWGHNMSKVITVIGALLFWGLLSPMDVASKDLPRKQNNASTPFAVSQIPSMATASSGFKMVSDVHTDIESVVVQSHLPDDPFIYDLLAAFRRSIHVVIVVDSQNKADMLFKNLKQKGIRDLQKRVKFVVVDDDGLNQWGRDSYTVLYSTDEKKFTLLPAQLYLNRQQAEEPPHEVFRAISQYDIGVSLIKNRFPLLPCWNLQGGAVTIDDRFAYVGSGIVENMYRCLSGDALPNRQTVIDQLQKYTGKKVIMFPASDFHSDRYHMPVGKTCLGDRTALLADPVKLLQILASLSPAEKLETIRSIQKTGISLNSRDFLNTEDGKIERKYLSAKLSDHNLADFLNITPQDIDNLKQSPYVQWLNQVENILTNNGIKVVRIPGFDNPLHPQRETLQSGFVETWYDVCPIGLYYVNLIQDDHQGIRTVYVPKYGIKKLDDRVVEILESLQCFKNIHQIRSVIEGTEGGGVRCRLQVFGKPSDD
jgi:hypothetical protein